MIKKCRPTVRRCWRLLLAGFIWLAVGIALTVVACLWLLDTEWPLNLGLAAASPCLGFLVSRLGFARIAARNIARLRQQPEPACVFSFQGWRSYLLIVIMMGFGYALRHLPVPKSVDAVIYFTMGSALAFSSSHYFRAFARESPAE